jgi:hypothetical protein
VTSVTRRLVLACLGSFLSLAFPCTLLAQEEPCVKMADGIEVCPQIKRTPSPAPAPPPAATDIGGRIFIQNNCESQIKIAVRFKSTAEEWTTAGWYRFDGKEAAVIRKSGSAARSRNSVFYYYAEGVRDGKKITWRGRDDDENARSYDVDGERYRFRRYVTEKDNAGDWRLALKCSSG